MSAMTRGRVPEISARHTQILRSHLTQRDVLPAFHRFYRSAQRAAALEPLSATKASPLNKKKTKKKTLKHFQGTGCSHQKTQKEGEAGTFNLTMSPLSLSFGSFPLRILQKHTPCVIIPLCNLGILKFYIKWGGETK